LAGPSSPGRTFALAAALAAALSLAPVTGFAQEAAAPAPPGGTTTQEGRAHVPANAEWFDTGTTLPAGSRVVLTAKGRWSNERTAAGAPGSWAGPAGFRDYKRPSALAPQQDFAALIGRVGGQVFYVGAKTEEEVVVVEGGRLQLSMNDDRGTFGDNDGVMEVGFRAEIPPPRNAAADPAAPEDGSTTVRDDPALPNGATTPVGTQAEESEKANGTTPVTGQESSTQAGTATKLPAPWTLEDWFAGRTGLERGAMALGLVLVVATAWWLLRPRPDPLPDKPPTVTVHAVADPREGWTVTAWPPEGPVLEISYDLRPGEAEARILEDAESPP